MVIGIPQALAYHYFYPLWRTFFTELGIEIKTSGLTDRCKLDLGLRIAPSEACLPLKCYLGHILSLVNNVDTIFVPRLVCLKKNPKTKLGCPKFIGLPDMCRALIPEARFITLDIDLRRQEEGASFRDMAKKLGRDSSQGKDAYQKGLEEMKKHKEMKFLKNRELTSAQQIAIGLLGHAYLLEDYYLNLNLVKKLIDWDCLIIDGHNLSIDIEKELDGIKPLSWFFEEEILAMASRFFHTDGLSGIVYLTSFGCGASSITNEIMELEIRGNSDVPLLRIILDEHTGEAGMITRLESFVDMIRLKNREREKGVKGEVS